MNDLIEKVSPQNLEAERAVLGSMLIEEEAIAKVINYIRDKEDFYSDIHQEIFEVIIEIYNKNKNVDFVIVAEKLKVKNRLKEIGGATYLNSLINSVATTANVEYYAKIVKEKAVLRNLIKLFVRSTELCYSEENYEEILAQVESSIISVLQDKIPIDLLPIKNLIHENINIIENLSKKKTKVPGLASGLIDLDNLTGGFYDSNLIVIAGRPTMGKTALCLSIALYAGVVENKSVAIFSLEMSKEELIFRLLCAEARVDLKKVRTGYINSEEWQLMMNSAGKIAQASIYIDDTPAISMLELKAKVRRLQREKGLDLIILDYLQLIPGRYRKPEYRRQEIEEITQTLKNLAKELRVPIILVSQLNRRPEDRKNKRPILSDLRESGAIEQDADTVIFIYREDNSGKAELIVAKQRNGEQGTVNVAFIGRWVKFENLVRGI